MNWYDAMEEAYKNGYDKGFRDAQKDVRHGHWISKGAFANNWAECSFCHVTGSPQWKVCPVCETKMDGKETT